MVFKRMVGLLAFMIATAFAPAAFAQCAYDGVDAFVCSGNSNGTVIFGTAGPDRFVFQDGVFGDIQIVSGGGADVIDFSSFTTPVTLGLSPAGQQTVTAGGLRLTLSGFDTPGQTYILTGGSAGDTLSGGAGNDRINGGGGADTLNGGSGDDVLIGGAGADALDGGPGADTRGDTAMADCAGDTLAGIETDLCPAPVPTLNEWARILLGLILAGGAALHLQRRHMAV